MYGVAESIDCMTEVVNSRRDLIPPGHGIFFIALQTLGSVAVDLYKVGDGRHGGKHGSKIVSVAGL